MQIKEKIHNFIERNFNDQIISVGSPIEWWCAYKDVGTRLEAYAVPVVYKYHGRQNVLFMIDNDHFCLIPPKYALKNAQRFQMRTTRKMYKQKSGTNDQEYLSVPIDISHMKPVYNARGRICAYNVPVKYYISKMFMYGYDGCTAETEKQNAASWVDYMQQNGYKVIGAPKYCDNKQTNSLNVNMLCEYNKRFNESLLGNAGARAWQFWIKKQYTVARMQKNQELMQIINENTK